MVSYSQDRSVYTADKHLSLTSPFVIGNLQHFIASVAVFSYLPDTYELVMWKVLYILFYFFTRLYMLQRGLMQSTSQLSLDCAATRRYYSLAATSHFFPFIGVMKNSDYTSLPLCLSLLSPVSRLSISLPTYRSPNPIRLLRLRGSHSEDTAAHLIWAHIKSRVLRRNANCICYVLVYAYGQKCCKWRYETDGRKLVIHKSVKKK